jgi:hypothetical protein
MKSIRAFFSNIRLKAMTRRIEQEIFFRIFDHLNRRRDFGYPFASDDDLETAVVHGNLDSELHLRMIEKEGRAMPEAYGKAFLYIVYRDINHRLASYRAFARKRAQPLTCHPRRIM